MLPSHLKKLELALASTDANVCHKAIEELSKSRHPYALDLLFVVSREDSTPMHVAAREAFARSVGRHPKIALRHTSLMLRHAAAETIGQVKCEPAISELARILRNDADAVMRTVCAESLGAIGTRDAADALAVASLDRSLEVRRAALTGLRRMGGSLSEQPVVGFLNDSDWPLRNGAREHLEAIGWAPTVRRDRALWGILKGRFDETVSQGNDAIDPLLTATLTVNDAEVRHWSAVALTRLKRQVILDRLFQAAHSSQPEIRAAALHALEVQGIQPPAPTVSKKTVVRPTRRRLVPVFEAAMRMLALIGHP